MIKLYKHGVLVKEYPEKDIKNIDDCELVIVSQAGMKSQFREKGMFIDSMILYYGRQFGYTLQSY